MMLSSQATKKGIIKSPGPGHNAEGASDSTTV